MDTKQVLDKKKFRAWIDYADIGESLIIESALEERKNISVRGYGFAKRQGKIIKCEFINGFDSTPAPVYLTRFTLIETEE